MPGIIFCHIRMKKLLLLLSTALVLVLYFGCDTRNAKSSQYDRPHDPFVFRSVLDGQPRMLTVALHDNMWAAYDTETGTLDKVWRGGINLDGAVYTTHHGPQPSSLGDAWFENQYDQPWTIDGQAATVRYRGHRLEDDGQATLLYDLSAAGKTIRVEETPEFVVNKSGQPGFQRRFKLDGADGAVVRMKANLSSVPLESSVVTSGSFSVAKKTNRKLRDAAGFDLDGELQLNDDETNFTSYFTKRPLIANKNKVVGAEDEEERPLGYRLIARSDCKSCHNTNQQTIGPAYVDVAKRYRNTEPNVKMLVNKVLKGGGGNWGSAVMSAHPDLTEADVKPMIDYIMGLDAAEEAELARMESAPAPTDLDLQSGDDDAPVDALVPGAIVKVMVFNKSLQSLSDVDWNAPAVFEGIIPQIVAGDDDLKDLPDNFAIQITGYLKIPKDNNYTFRLRSDDGSKLFIDGNEIIDHDGLHGASAMDGEIALSKGYHPFRVEFFQGGGGKSLRLQWRSFDDGEFANIPPTIFLHNREESNGVAAFVAPNKIPGDRDRVAGVHPSYTLSQARPDEFLPKVGGIAFTDDGRMVVSTWDAAGSVYLLDNLDAEDHNDISYKRIAVGLAEPLGIEVVDGDIYVLQKQEFTRLVDTDGDDVIDEYHTVANSWPVTANFHEFAFGLVYKEPYFYGTLAIAILPGGASANPQASSRGKAVRIHKETGEVEYVAHGLRTPNGIGVGVDGELFIADNQGDWLPSSKILHLSEGAFFGSRAVDPVNTPNMEVKQPVVWLPQDEIGNSPTTPLALNDGPYKGQMIHSEVTHGGAKRVFVEKVDGEYQGAVFRFTQGIEAGVNRMAWGPDGALYLGGIGSSGNWGDVGKQWYGLQRMQYNNEPTFEMLAVRAKANGMEIELTEPLPDATGWDPAAYTVQQWRYVPTENYGGPKVDLENLRVKSASVSSDRKRIFLELDGLKKEHVVYLRLPNDWTSENDREIWSTEAWYTLNNIPQATGTVASAPALPGTNELSAAERAAGWKLLFDGQNLNEHWHTYGSDAVNGGWTVDGDAFTFNKAGGRGDLVSDQAYENFDLRLEWKISNCGNSGIFWGVVDDPEQYSAVYLTGPEMQILDNSCHPDAQYEDHRAGDLYDMIPVKYETVRPAGSWNKARIRKQGEDVTFYLNGRKVVEFKQHDETWDAMVKDSKFADWEAFGKSRKGHFALQDHDDRVWFRNVKVRVLDDVM